MGTVGSRTLRVQDPLLDLEFPVWLLYPSAGEARAQPCGPYVLALVPDGPAAGTGRTLLLLSHGGGSTPLVYRGIAWFLASQGFIVALPQHPGNHRGDNSLENTRENLERRPRHLALSLAAASEALAVAPEVGVIGHSLGGYTALAAAGGQPYYGHEQPLAVQAEPSIRALALLAPATAFFTPPHSLQGVTSSVLLRGAEFDRITPRWQYQLLLDLLPNPEQLDAQIAPAAGHHSFLSPFPETMQRPDFPPALDPPGFDRPAYHRQLHRELAEFFRQRLNRSPA